MWQVLQQIADLFCEWYDELDPLQLRRDVEAWSADAALAAMSAAIERDAARGWSVASPRLRVENGGGDRQARLFAALRGLDRVFAHLVPAFAGVPPGWCAEAAVEVAVRGRLDSGAQGGMLLPRLVTRGRPGRLPDHPREAFASVLRVPPEACAICEHVVVPVAARLHRRDLALGLAVGCAPSIADPDELRFTVRESAAGRFYRIAPRDLDVTVARVEAVLDGFVSAGVQIGVLPELCLSRKLLETWRAALRRREDLGRLRWVLVGSGDVDGEDVPVNAAVLLDARSGAILGRQDKLHRFNMDVATLDRLGLRGLLGDEPVDEDIRCGDRLVILDAGGVRLAILVCEDLARVEDLAAHVRAFGVSHVLVPVFGRPIQDRRWERQFADVHVAATGSTIVVANSLVVVALLGTAAPGTALVAGPALKDALVLRAADAADVVTVVLHADGSATPSGSA